MANYSRIINFNPLTANEYLQFIARLKGVKIGDIDNDSILLPEDFEHKGIYAALGISEDCYPWYYELTEADHTFENGINTVLVKYEINDDYEAQRCGDYWYILMELPPEIDDYSRREIDNMLADIYYDRIDCGN